MFFLKSIFNQIKFYLLGFLIVYSLSITGLYLHSQNTSIKLSAKLQEVSGALESEVDGRFKDKLSYEQDMRILNSLFYKLDIRTEVETDLLSQIDYLVYLEKDCPPQVTPTIVNNGESSEFKKNTVNLSDDLPVDLTRVLDTAYNQGREGIRATP